MTKEKTLSESFLAEHPMHGNLFLEKDVSLAVKRFKEELDDEHVIYWINKIFGSFDDIEQKEDKKT